MSGLIGGIGSRSGAIGNTVLTESGCLVQMSGGGSETGYFDMPFNSKIYDIANEYNTSTHLFTAKSAGKYLVIVQISWDGLNDGIQIQARIEVEGTVVSFGRINNGRSDHATAYTSKVVEVAAGDEIGASAYNTHNRNWLADTDCFMSIQRLN